MTWLALLADTATGNEHSVLVTVAAVKGSSPREAGAAMLVTATRVLGSVGGGTMEFVAIETARQLLHRDPAGTQRLSRYDLVPADAQHSSGGCAAPPEAAATFDLASPRRLGQCCGGVVYLHFECFSMPLPHWVEQAIEQSRLQEPALIVSEWDAGRSRHRLLRESDLDTPNPPEGLSSGLHSRLTRLLAEGQAANSLVFNPAGEALPQGEAQSYVLVRHLVANDFVPVIFGAGHVGRALVGILAPLTGRLLWCDSRREEFPEQVPGRVEIAAEEPLEVIRRAPPGAYFVVMTHSHALDLTLCEAILKRGSFRYLGVIGSRSKRARFEQQLRAQGIAEEDLTRMICPIGVDGIRDKQPAAIAVAVAAQLLQVRER